MNGDTIENNFYSNGKSHVEPNDIMVESVFANFSNFGKQIADLNSFIQKKDDQIKHLTESLAESTKENARLKALLSPDQFLPSRSDIRQKFQEIRKAVENFDKLIEESLSYEPTTSARSILLQGINNSNVEVPSEQEPNTRPSDERDTAASSNIHTALNHVNYESDMAFGVADIRYTTNKQFAHVDFKSPEAMRKAIELNSKTKNPHGLLRVEADNNNNNNNNNNGGLRHQNKPYNTNRPQNKNGNTNGYVQKQHNNNKYQYPNPHTHNNIHNSNLHNNIHSNNLHNNHLHNPHLSQEEKDHRINGWNKILPDSSSIVTQGATTPSNSVATSSN
ncbi:5852_t:CDS:2 [Diversispora eburnea]|uniref:5852_t:CDS:1 n=1 Tax=Diversispora eburnea TaxID=1213867 RepID=A0A9N8VFL0_9GLOM|nr:5852_t:CDS:2 [Diversispora eburnea]